MGLGLTQIMLFAQKTFFHKIRPTFLFLPSLNCAQIKESIKIVKGEKSHFNVRVVKYRRDT